MPTSATHTAETMASIASVMCFSMRSRDRIISIADSDRTCRWPLARHVVTPSGNRQLDRFDHVCPEDGTARRRRLFLIDAATQQHDRLRLELLQQRGIGDEEFATMLILGGRIVAVDHHPV